VQAELPTIPPEFRGPASHRALPPFPFPPFKDSPISGGNDTAEGILDGSSISNATAEGNSSAIRKSRREVVEWGANGRLEADLSAELTVLPLLNSSTNTEEMDAASQPTGNSPTSTTATKVQARKTDSTVSLSLAITVLLLAGLVLAQSGWCGRWRRWK